MIDTQEKVFDLLEKIKGEKSVNLKKCSLIKQHPELRPYQTIGTACLVATKRYVLGDDVGLGKTFESIAAFAYLRESDPSRKLLVICNKSALYQWPEEINTLLSANLKIRVVKASGKNSMNAATRAALYHDHDWDVLVMTYATYRNDHERLIPAIKLRKVIVALDEVQAVKNRKSKLRKAIKTMLPHVNRAYGITATILQNRLEEGYSIFDLLVPGIFGTFQDFSDRYLIIKKIPIKTINRYGTPFTLKVDKVIGHKNLAHFREVIKPFFVGRSAEEVGEELPDIVSKPVYLEFEDDQRALYEEAESGVLNLPDNAVYDMKEVLPRLTMCQVLADSPSLKKFPVISAKEEEIQRLLEDELYGEKVIIFSTFKMMISRLCQLLVKYTPLRITGDEDAEQRERAKKLFLYDPNYKLIIVNKAGHDSINLQSVKHLIFYDLPWSAGVYHQMVGRGRRIKAVEKTIFVHNFILRDSIDEDVLVTLRRKEALINAAVPKKGHKAYLTFDGEDVSPASSSSENVNDFGKDVINSMKERVKMRN